MPHRLGSSQIGFFPRYCEQNPQSARRNNFSGEQISRWFLLLSENLSASNYPGAACADRLRGESAKLWGDSGMLGGDDRMSSALSRVILPEKMMYRVPTEKSRVVWKTSRHEPLREAYGGCQRIERS